MSEWRAPVLEGLDEAAGDGGESSRGGGRIQRRLLRTLEDYLARSAADLDERGEELLRRGEELERVRERLEAEEETARARLRRLEELGVDDRPTVEQLEALLEQLRQRDEQLRVLGEHLGTARHELDTTRAALEEHERYGRDLAGHLAARDEVVSELQQQLVAMSAELVAKSDQLALTEREVSEARARVEERERRAASVEEHLAGRVEEIERLEWMHREVAQRAEALERAHEQATRSVDRLSAVLVEREAEIEALADAARERLPWDGAARHPAPAPEALPEPATHLRFVPRASGYLLVDSTGPPPPVGAAVDVEGDGAARFTVVKLGRSPLPQDHRRCAFLTTAPADA